MEPWCQHAPMLVALVEDEDCPVCYQRSRLRRLSPCGHGLCVACVKKIEQYASSRGKDRRCPMCRQTFMVLHRPPSLVDVCIKRLEWRLPKAKDMSRLSPVLRAQLLKRMKNRRMLYGSTLVELSRGLKLDVLPLHDACNMTKEDFRALLHVLEKPLPTAVILRNVSLLDDEALGLVLRDVAPTLEHLDASSTEERFEGAVLEEFSLQLPCLSKLILTDCRKLLPSAVEAVAAGCAKTLKFVDLGGCLKLGNEVMLSLAGCRQLVSIGARGLWKLETDPVVRVLESCTNLQRLELTFCNRVSGPQVFRAVAGYSTAIRELLVGAVGGIDDDAVLSLALSTAGASLESLALSRSDITARSLKALREHCPRLQRLDISDCHEITESSLVDAIVQMPQLRLLQVKYCRGISTQMQLLVAQLLAGRSLGIDDAPDPKGQAAGSSTERRMEPVDEHGCASSAVDHASQSSTSVGRTSRHSLWKQSSKSSSSSVTLDLLSSPRAGGSAPSSSDANKVVKESSFANHGECSAGSAACHTSGSLGASAWSSGALTRQDYGNGSRNFGAVESPTTRAPGVSTSSASSSSSPQNVTRWSAAAESPSHSRRLLGQSAHQTLRRHTVSVADAMSAGEASRPIGRAETATPTGRRSPLGSLRQSNTIVTAGRVAQHERALLARPSVGGRQASKTKTPTR